MSTQTTSGSATTDSTDSTTNTDRESKETNTTNESPSSSSTPQIVSTPTSASSVAAEEEEEDAVLLSKKTEVTMSDKATGKLPSSTVETRATQDEATTTPEVSAEKKKEQKKKKKAKAKTDQKSKAKKKVVKKAKKRKDDSSDDESTASEDSDSSDSEADSESESSDDSSEDEREKQRLKKKNKAALKKLKEKLALKKAKQKKKSKKHDSSSEESSDSSDSSSSDSESETEAEKKRRRKKKAKRRRSKKDDSSSDDSSSEDEKEKTKTTTEAATTDAAATTAQTEAFTELQKKLTELQAQAAVAAVASTTAADANAKKDDKKKGKKSKLEFKRVDEVWDNKLRNWTIKTTTEEKTDDFDCVFAIRRKFDWEGKRHVGTVLDIKSKPLQESLQEILKDVRFISLVEDNPSIDPHLMFLYQDELKVHYKKTLKSKLRKERKKKQKKRLEQRIAHCKLLSGYLDEDYAETKRKLKPMLKAGTITYDLLWALFKPNTIAYTPTYGVSEDPRCFKVDYAWAQSNFFGEWYSIEGRYLEYDGKHFGLGDFSEKIDKFKGVKKITSLETYPLSCHKDPEGIEKKLIERGKKFVALQGMSYRSHKGLAFVKKKKGVGKININGRVMIDPAIFRRLNPNYLISSLHKKDDDEDDDEEDEADDEDGEGCVCDHEDEDADDGEKTPEFKYKFYKDKDDKWHVVRVPVLDGNTDITHEQLEQMKRGKDDEAVFTEEDLLIASPVVLGFAFSEKLWLEFSLSGIKDIEWNASAFDSLVLPTTTKQNLRGLVSSHRFNAAKTIDDVIQGKGKGLNVVLHGPPGVGKTLTAESIAEYLKAPLYAVSAGELGTSSRQIEQELNRIMEITHSWGAILLLDEADVFLEQRAANDVHRNALVSVFLRLLEYYQGILFLTTNRVSTFDEAFQSRIHMGIRYENLTAKARLEIWRSYINKVRTKMEAECPGKEGKEWKDSEFEELAKKPLNGRQIKNACTTAQSITLAEGGEWGIAFVRRVLDVQEDFEQDLRGGFGYRDAMRQYT